MGSLFKPKQPAPPPPAPPVTVRDQVNGVEQVPVTNADGSITYVTRQIPLTAEQQAQKNELEAVMRESLAEIKRLSASDYAPDEDTKRILDQWTKTQEQLLGDRLASRGQQEEELLARRGLGDSAQGQAVRRQRLLDEQRARENLSLQRDELQNQVRGERLGLQQNLYNLASSQTNAETARVAQAATRGQSQVAALNAQRQASLLDYYNAGQGGSAFGESLSSSLGRGIGGAIGSVVGGVPGTVAGGFLGSLFRR